MDVRDLARDQLAQTGLGLAIGTLARYAMRIQDRLPIGAREIAADILLLGMNALLTLYVIERLGATGKGAVLTAAMFGIAQDRVIRVIRKRFERRAAAIESAIFGETLEAEKPVAAPAHAKPASLGDDLRAVFGKPIGAPPPDDQIALLRKLDKED